MVYRFFHVSTINYFYFLGFKLSRFLQSVYHFNFFFKNLPQDEFLFKSVNKIKLLTYMFHFMIKYRNDAR